MTERQLFLRFLAQTSDAPLLLEIAHAEGVWMTDVNGKRYLDLISGIGVSNVGHRHPHVISAIHAQLDRYMHLMVYGEYVQTPQVRLAEALVATLPAPIDSVYLVSSGSEAIEGAMKLAKRCTGRQKILSCHNAYHGSTHGALSAGGNAYFKDAYRPLLPGVEHIHYGSFSDLQTIASDTAAVLVETIQGEAGVIGACPEWFGALRQVCTQAGALLIVDEIQCGMGRTGTFWAFEQMKIVPDVVVAAKALGAGMPIGAFMAPKDLMQTLKEAPVLGHITTFGGHPVCAAAALAGIQVLQQEHLVEQVEAKARILRDRLKHPRLLGMRQYGLMMALELGSFEVLKPILNNLLDRGIVADWFLHCDTAMRIAPPLVIGTEELHHACDTILAVLDDV